MIESWIGLALAAAASKALKPPAMRLGGNLGIPASAMAWAAAVGALPALTILLIIGGIPPEIGRGFIPALIVASGFGVFASVFQARAFSRGDISLVAPFEAVVIAFAAIGGFLILGERMSATGLLGMFILLGGTLVLRGTASMDMDSLKRNKEAIAMIIFATAIWGFSVNFEKVGILLSSATFFAFWLSVLLSLFLLPSVWRSRRTIFKKDGRRKQRIWTMVVIGTVTGLTMVFQFSAFALTNISYVLGVKQLSVLAAPILGGALFNEKGVLIRLIAAILMVIGVIFIAQAV